MSEAPATADDGGDAPTATSRLAVDLGDVDPAGSRHRGRRSSVALCEGRLVVGTADGEVRAHDRSTGEPVWRRDAGGGVDDESAREDGESPSIVALEPVGRYVAVGTRGSAGTIALLDAADGTVAWRLDAAADHLGPPQRDTRFFLPYVAALAADGDRLYAACRRYERSADGDRRFESVVYAVELDAVGGGTDGGRPGDDRPEDAVAWRYVADASPIALAADGTRVAVAYNRCPGEHDDGVVALDPADGAERWCWDPGTDGGRRAGDVALRDGAAFVASHGDYRGYRIEGGAAAWRTDLATPESIDGEAHYAYPNHVHAGPSGVVFVTGNTYAADSRETAGLHPAEHTAFGYDAGGERRWSADVGGFAGGVGADGDRVAVPAAQHFRERTPDAHGLLVLDCESGIVADRDADGVLAAAAVAVAVDPDAGSDVVAAVEEPVVYHDEGEERGAYRAHLFDS